MELRLKALDALLQIPRREFQGDSPCRDQIDLHTHSSAFDGYDTPTALILEAFERGLNAVAITDQNKPPFDDNLEA